MADVTPDVLEAAREALRRYAWREGYELLEQADAAAPLSPEDLEGFASAAWWTGRLDACIAARQRAFTAYLTADEKRRAAIVAMALAKDHYAKGAPSIGSAWVTRAERLLVDEADCVERGYLERLLSAIAFEGRADFDAALEHAERALETAKQFGDRELQAVALHDQGRILVAKGDVATGMALIDEATAAAVSGELSPYHTGVVYCNTITACKDLADFRRAGDWTEAAKRWCDSQSIAGFPGMCRVYRASIMVVRGAWPEAELEARRACDELKEFNLGYAAEAFYELGEIRMRRGDVAAAQVAFDQAHELGRDPQPGLALLRLSQGNVEGARACIANALDDEARLLHRARLLPAQVEIALAAGDIEAARTAADDLAAISKTFGSEALEAASCCARSMIAGAEGDAQLAVRSARQGLRLWQEVGAPFEVAQARMLLAAGYVVEGDADSAIRELQAAASTFERLGAVPDARRAHAHLAALGAAHVAAGAGERRFTRTFMFTDIVSSTELIAAIGDDAWADVLAWHDNTLRSLFAAHGGEEIHHAGDGFFVALADPAAAVECAVAVQRALQDHRRAHGFAPSVRVGLHAADATRDSSGYQGKGVHEAARIAAQAEAGEILASTSTLAGTSLRFPTSPPRLVELRSISEPVELVSVEWRA